MPDGATGRPTTGDPEILREQSEIEFEQRATSNKQIVRQWLTWFRRAPHRILKLVESGLTLRRESSAFEGDLVEEIVGEGGSRSS